MACDIKIDSAAIRDLDKLDPPIAKRILLFLHERVATLDDLRSIGEALKSSKCNFKTDFQHLGVSFFIETHYIILN